MKVSTKTTIATVALAALITAGVTYGTTKTAMKYRCRRVVGRECKKLLPKQKQFCEDKAKEVCDV